MKEQTLGIGLAKALKSHGVDVVFGIPGVHNIEMYRGLETAGISHFLARHEQGAGFMADGYARATGKPGVAFVITGPGLTNIMTPMGQAYSDSVPMLVISSCLPVVAPAPGQLHQMLDQTGAAATVCDWSVRADDGVAAYAALNQAFDEFTNQRCRPKHISIPIDVLGAPSLANPDVVTHADLPGAPGTDVLKLAHRLNQAKRPLFIIGGGAVKAAESANEVIEKLGAAVFTTYAGRGVIDPSYPLLFGAALARPDSRSVIAQADLVVVAGSELAQVDLWRNSLGHQSDLVRIDIDPQVLNDQHGADMTICGDADVILTALSPRLKSGNRGWRAKDVAQARDLFRAQSDAERPGILPYVDAMHAVLSDDALIYSDMTQFAYVAKEIYPMSQPSCWHHPYGFGTLGYAMPAAIGGKIGCPKRQVVAIAGDSGFQYTLSQLGLAAELSLTLPIILWDNARLKEIQDAMVNAQIAPNAVVAKNPDFRQLAAAYGIEYTCPIGPTEFQSALRSALGADGPTIIHLSPE